MRPDSECRQAYLDRQIESLERLGRDVLIRVNRGPGSRLVAHVVATYLGIHEQGPRRIEDSLLGPIIAGMWEPEDASQIRPVKAEITVGIEVLGPEGRPALMILPGSYPPILHPHVTPALPAGVCLTDDFRPDTTDLADVIIGLVRMLRFDEGTYSLRQGDALAPGVCRWLAEGAIDQFDLPLTAAEPAGIRIIERAGGGDDDDE